MALQFDLVSPERRLASLQATEVQIPGADGDLTAMEGHAPTITTLRPGVLKVVGAAGTTSYVVTGGFVTAANAFRQLDFLLDGEEGGFADFLEVELEIAALAMRDGGFGRGAIGLFEGASLKSF